MSSPGNDATDITHGLTDEQRRAVVHDAGPLAVLAGPGTGKTRVIVHRIARLVAPRERGGLGAAPESVAALAFTVKSAEEMRERLASLIGPSVAERVRLSTVHALGRSIVRRFGDWVGVRADAQIIDPAVRRRTLRALILEHGLFREQAALGARALATAADTFIDRCRCEGVSPQRVAQWVAARRRALATGDHALDAAGVAAERARLAQDEDRARLFALYERACEERGHITFDDYIRLPIRVLREREAAAAILRDETRHVVVDEFQDWNRAQIDLLTLLCPPAGAGRAGPDVCVVGDDDQAIYAFRGADDRAFQRFHDAYPDHASVELTVNHRSAAAIIDASNRVIARANQRFRPDKRSAPAPGRRPDLEPASVEGVTVADDKRDLARTAAAIILADRAASPVPRPWSDYAILCRTNAFLEEAAATLQTLNLPIAVRLQERPGEDEGVRDALAWLTLLTRDDQAHPLQRILARPPFRVHPDRLAEWTASWRRARRNDPAITFPRHLRAAHGEEPEARSALGLLEEFRGLAAAAPVDAVLTEVVRRAGLAHAEFADSDPADPSVSRLRAARVRALVQLILFARRAAPFLGPPADCAAFLEHLDDLDERDRQALSSAGDERVDMREDGFAGDPGGVRLLTAHTAKGLEFDTVIALRVRPQYGFPLQEATGNEALPESLSGRPPQDHADEERRLFYVACTRAKRRLVLLAKHVKKSGAPLDFFRELTAEGDAAARVPVVPGDSWVDRASLQDAVSPDDAALALAGAGPDHERERRDWAEFEAARVRRSASAALFEASRPHLREADLARIERRLQEAVHVLAALARIRDGAAHGDAPPAGAHGGAVLAVLERRAAHLAGQPGPALFRPVPAPLSLSYSQVADYTACPRCFYVKTVLGLDEPKTDALALGSAVHSALEHFLDESRSAESEGRPAPGLDRLLAIGRARLDADWPRGAPEVPDARARLDALLTAGHALHDHAAEIISVERATRFPYTIDGVRHEFVAKIDRVERLPGDGARYRVVDYKTGNATKKLTEPKADDLQMSVYAIALPWALGLAEPGDDGSTIEPGVEGVAEYWVLSEPGGARGLIDLGRLKLAKAREAIEKAARGMLTGDFDRTADGCKGLCSAFFPGGDAQPGDDAP